MFNTKISGGIEFGGDTVLSAGDNEGIKIGEAALGE